MKDPGLSQAPAPEEGVVRVGLQSLLALHEDAKAIGLQPRQVRALAPGAHRSPFKGRGMEFDEVRPYVPGDDVRSIDWRVMARSGRPHTKLFREERERAVLLWVDLRPAMFFATRGAFKAVRAAQAAALLGWATLRQGDRLGALIFDDEHHLELEPRRGRAALVHLLARLADHPAWQRGPSLGAGGSPEAPNQALNQALARLQRVTQPGSLVVVASDLSLLDGDGPARLARLARHNEVLVLHLHDPLEAELPPAGLYRLSDGQRFIALETGDAGRRERYREHHARRLEAFESLCRRHGLVRVSLSTADDPATVLRRALGARPLARPRARARRASRPGSRSTSCGTSTSRRPFRGGRLARRGGSCLAWWCWRSPLPRGGSCAGAATAGAARPWRSCSACTPPRPRPGSASCPSCCAAWPCGATPARRWRP